MIIVSGALYVDETERQSYLKGCRDVIEAARKSDGCIDFHLAADPIERDRINVYEQWESVDAVESFRGSGPSSEQAAAIRHALVFQHEVASSKRLQLLSHITGTWTRLVVSRAGLNCGRRPRRLLAGRSRPSQMPTGSARTREARTQAIVARSARLPWGR